MSGLSEISPLNDLHLTEINSALLKLDLAFQQIALAKQAGLDVSAQEQQANATRDSLLRIKQVYFPGR